MDICQAIAAAQPHRTQFDNTWPALTHNWVNRTDLKCSSTWTFVGFSVLGDMFPIALLTQVIQTQAGGILGTPRRLCN